MENGEMLKLSDYVFEFVANLKIHNIFLLPGGGCMYLVDSLGKRRDLNAVSFLHEQAATIAAEAYAQYTNNIGVVLITTGPGGTNTITGVAGAWIDSTPLLVLSGQVKRNDMIGDRGVRQMGIQEVDIVSIVKPITKYAITVMEPEKIRYHLERALYLAQSGRPGPVWIDIPLDVQAAKIHKTALEGFAPHELGQPSSDEQVKKQVAQAIELLNSSERPVILAGNGIRLSGALEKFLALLEILKIPVLTTWKAIDFLPEDHPLFFGRPGSIARRGANFVQQNSDWITTIGARLDLAQVGYNYCLFARAAKKVIVDVDENEIKKLDMNIDIPIVADATTFINEFLKQAERIVKKDRSFWLERCSKWKSRYPVILPEYSEPDDYVNSYHFVDVLSKLLTSNDVLVPGSAGSCNRIVLQAFRVKKGQRIFNSPGLASMGFGLPASIGACLASGRKRTITIIGDGGLQHNIQELETVARLKLPLKIFICNNYGYALIRMTQKQYFNGHYVCCDPSSGLTFPETGKIANAYKIPYVKVKNNTALCDKVIKVLDTPGPVICELLVDPMLPIAPKLSSEVKPNGRIVSKPLEDLWPFLDRKEFAKNMIIKPLEK